MNHQFESNLYLPMRCDVCSKHKFDPFHVEPKLTETLDGACCGYCEQPIYWHKASGYWFHSGTNILGCHSGYNQNQASPKLPKEPKLPETFEQWWDDNMWLSEFNHEVLIETRKAISKRAWYAGRGAR